MPMIIGSEDIEPMMILKLKYLLLIYYNFKISKNCSSGRL